MDNFIKIYNKDANSTDEKKQVNSKFFNYVSTEKKHDSKKVEIIKTLLYKKDYLDFDFTWTGSRERYLPIYIMCGRKFSNCVMVLAKFKTHLLSKHSTLSH